MDVWTVIGLVRLASMPVNVRIREQFRVKKLTDTLLYIEVYCRRRNTKCYATSAENPAGATFPEDTSSRTEDR